MAYRLLKEWLDDNTNKAYPFAYTADISLQPLLTDFLLCVAGVNNPAAYIKSIENTANALLLTITVIDRDTNDEYDIDDVIAIPKTNNDFQQLTFTGSSETMAVSVQGSLCTGLYSVIEHMNTITGLDRDTGGLYDGCVTSVNMLVTRLVVDNQILTGDIILEEGPGIVLTPTIDDDGKAVVSISVADHDFYTKNLDVVDDSSLVAEAMNIIGRPVTKINNIKPDANGNIRIADSTDVGVSDKLLYVNAVGIGNGAVRLDVPGMVVTEEDISARISTIVNSISSLNERTAFLQNFCTSLETALNFVNTQLAQIK